MCHCVTSVSCCIHYSQSDICIFIFDDIALLQNYLIKLKPFDLYLFCNVSKHIHKRSVTDIDAHSPIDIHSHFHILSNILTYSYATVSKYDFVDVGCDCFAILFYLISCFGMCRNEQCFCWFCVYCFTIRK